MTLTINPESYAFLPAKARPKAIETEQENDRAITLATEDKKRTAKFDGSFLSQRNLTRLLLQSDI
jgi:hypothetical protein